MIFTKRKKTETHLILRENNVLGTVGDNELVSLNDKVTLTAQGSTHHNSAPVSVSAHLGRETFHRKITTLHHYTHTREESTHGKWTESERKRGRKRARKRSAV